MPLHTETVFLDFASLDPGGVLYFAEIFRLAHQTYERFVVDTLQISWEQWFQNASWIVPIRHSAADFLAPIVGGQKLVIELDCAEVRSHSFRLIYSFTQAARLVAQVQTVHVFCDRKTGKKREIPADVYGKFFENACGV